ncbi:MAG: phosphohydrolase [Pseudomonadota bacterium]
MYKVHNNPHAVVEQRAWVRLPSGQRLDLLNPAPACWDNADLALGLARTYRWGGHSAWALPLSVAQHSLTVMHLRRQQSGGPRHPLDDLRELLHDAEEGLLGFDCISVLKPFLGDAFSALSERLQQAVELRYGLPAWSEDEFRLHKRADRIAAASEALHVAGWTRGEVQHILGIAELPLEADPLVVPYHCTPWEPWPPVLACERFLDELERLQAACVGSELQGPSAQPPVFHQK